MGYLKRYNTHVMGITDGEERESIEKIFEAVITENFPKLMLNIKPRIHKAQRIPNRINARKKIPPNKQTNKNNNPAPRHII